jgi:hypothetical protein
VTTPPPESGPATVEHLGDTVAVHDPCHGTVTADTDAFGAAVSRTADNLRDILARHPSPDLTGREPLITLAALAAAHASDEVAAPRPAEGWPFLPDTAAHRPPPPDAHPPAAADPGPPPPAAGP